MRARSLAHQRLGDILRDGGDNTGALEQFRSYRDLMAALVKAELPNAPNWTWRLDLWIGHQRIGDILFAQKDYAGALAEYEFYNKRAGEAARLDADNGEWQRFLANSHVLIGDVLLAQDLRRGPLRNTLPRLRFIGMWRRIFARARCAISRSAITGWERRDSAMGEAGQAQVEFEACLAIQVDETALDAQILTPKFVRSACREQAAQATGSIAGR